MSLQSICQRLIAGEGISSLAVRCHSFVNHADELGIRSIDSVFVLYHGTTPEAAASILTEGFRYRRQGAGPPSNVRNQDPCVRHGRLLGDGVYMTPQRGLAATYGSPILTCLVI